MNLDGSLDDDDIAFVATYGGWDPLSVAEVSNLLVGFPHPWWLVGGHAIDAFTGVTRPHADIDISFFPDAIPDLRKHLEGHYHLWSNHGGTFRVFDEAHPDPLHPIAQIWARRNAQSPWVLDCVPTPSVDGRWQSKRDPEHVANLDDVTWMDDRGLRVLNPEVVLLFKAAQDRTMDRYDLARTWPLMNEPKRDWLRAALQRYNPAHAWHSDLANS